MPTKATEPDLKALIKKLGMSQERAARLLGVAFSTFNAWANAVPGSKDSPRKSGPTPEVLRAIATLELLHREEYPTWCKDGAKIAEDVGALRKHIRGCERCLTAVEYIYRETR